jgi:tRNA A-37 threonylcarbamoyl transferase component Bud32
VTDARAPLPTVPGLTGLTVLARGGYATVYRAVQESVGRDVAVKVENRTLESDRDRRRFLREARAAGRMSSHPHVVDLFDAGVTGGGHPYLIMELCEGSYAERMKTNPLAAAEVRDVGVKIADALADAHALGVLHRDVKPANILMSRFGEPALADFGLAILAETRDHSITLDVLTPAYAPPEMFRYAPPSPAADVYALCATLYALMRGKPPRWREDRNPSLVSLVDMFAQPIPDLPGVPAELLALLRAGMANEEHDRPSAAQLRDALNQLVIDAAGRVLATPPLPVAGGGWGGAGAPGTPVTADEERTQPHRAVPLDPPAAWHAGPGAAAPPVAAAPSGPGGPPGAARPPRRPVRWLAAGALALVLVAGGLTWYAVGRRAVPLVPVGRRSPSPAASASPAAASPRPSAGASGGPPCLVAQLEPGIRCLATAECYDALAVNDGVARGNPLPCERPHTWEAFALVDLPSGMTSVTYQAVKDDPTIAVSCSTFTLVLLGETGLDWQVDVLPPSPDAFAAGDRTVRCLAGHGPGKLTGARFAPHA